MNIKYYLSALSAFIIWGLFSLVLRPLSDYSAYEILFYRVLFATGFIWLVSFSFRRKKTLASIRHLRSVTKGERREVFLNYLVSAVMLAFNWYLFIYAMNRISVNSTSLAYLICPTITTALAAIFLEERLRIGQWIAVAISFVACLLLSIGHFVDLFYSFAIALTYAIYLILQKRNSEDRFFSLAIHISVSTMVLAPILLSQDSEPPIEWHFYGYTFLIAVLFTIVPLFLNAYALKGLSSSLVGVLLYINPILSFALAVGYFGEVVTGLQLAAYGMIVLSVVLFNLVYFYRRKRDVVIENTTSL